MNKNINTGDKFSILRDASARLADATNPITLTELLSVDQSVLPHVDALIDEYTHNQKPNIEFEEQIWKTLDAYFERLNEAYIQVLQKVSQEDNELIEAALGRRMRVLGLIAQGHFLRYQPLPDNFWLQLHGIYQSAERVHQNAHPACDAQYLQILMLDTLNRTNMLKQEIALLSKWLGSWCEGMELTREHDETQHVFFVDLLEDRGARRMRDFMPSPSYRYWHVDHLIAKLAALMQQLNNNILPAEFAGDTTLSDAISLVEQLVTQWSSDDYRRQRRSESREGVSKSAQAVHGIFNICQHVKNLAFAGSVSVSNTDLDADLLEDGVQENKWVIENESTFGFGAVVNAKLNLWLKPGRLISLDYELNPDLTVVGVVRSIQQQTGDTCYVGIEVLSHTPSYVRLAHLAGEDAGSGTEPFSALYLPKDEERDQAATVVLPDFEYIPFGRYRLKLHQRTYRVVLGEEVERKDDWLRANVEIVATGV